MGYDLKEKAVPRVNEGTCAGCGLCVQICGDRVLLVADGKAHPSGGTLMGCIGCGQCAAICPTGSITVTGRGMAPGRHGRTAARHAADHGRPTRNHAAGPAQHSAVPGQARRSSYHRPHPGHDRDGADGHSAQRRGRDRVSRARPRAGVCRGCLPRVSSGRSGSSIP